MKPLRARRVFARLTSILSAGIWSAGISSAGISSAGISSAGIWLAGISLAGALALSACGYGGKGVSQRATPPDPPPIPQPKPTRPAGLGSAVLGPAVVGPAVVGQAEPAQAAPLPAAVRQVPLPLPSGQAHTVRRGETVYRISRLYGVPIRSVIDANGLTPPYTLEVGQRLTIVEPPSHEVRPGETVYGISRRYGVDMTALVRLNLIAAPYQISPGQKLLLPGGGTPAPANTTAPAKNTTSAKNTAAAATPSAVVPAPKAIPKPPPRQNKKFLWPVKGRLVLGYGPGKNGLHNDGINIAAPRGTAVLAAENGVVAYAGNELRGFGNLLLIKHADGWITAYAHTEAILVGRGAQVRRGQAVARVGDTGSVVAPQLHFEIRKGTRAVNPSHLLGPQNAAWP